MIIDGYDTKDLKFIGFFDSLLFHHNANSGGYVFEDKTGKKIYFTQRQVNKAIKQKEA